MFAFHLECYNLNIMLYGDKQQKKKPIPSKKKTTFT